jgi:NAD(P)H dehydrogenase (quinone)
MKIYLLLAHPDRGSFCGALADAFEAAAVTAGHEVRRQNLGEMDFDPILWKGQRPNQSLESSLEESRRHILWCALWVIVYPIWWGSVPALLKGYIDRVLSSGFAFRYHDKGPLWDKLLTGRRARLITTCDAPRFWIWLMYRSSDLHAMREATLKFCGVSPVRVTRIDRVRLLTEVERARCIERVGALGRAP